MQSTLAILAHTRISDSDFVEVLAACRPWGGLIRGEQLFSALGRKADVGKILRFYDDLEAGRLLNLDFLQTHWFPAFQFRSGSHRARASVRSVIGVFAGTRSSAELVFWMTRAQVRLGNRCPLDVLDQRLDRILEIAEESKREGQTLPSNTKLDFV